MKWFLRHPDATGRFDPPGVDTIRQTPGRVEKEEEADVIFIPFARFDGFRFDERLNDIKKPWVFFDWSEFGWDDPGTSSYLWGANGRTAHPAFGTEELVKFDQFVFNHPPILTFQRELLATDQPKKVLPLEYLNWLPEVGNDTKDDFMKRPIEVEFDWGRSHEGRPWLHGAIFQGMTRFGYEVVSEFAHLEHVLRNGHSRIWLSVHTPHYARLDVHQLQGIVRRSMITVVMPGAGRKTFRDGERCSDAIMAMPRHDLAVAYPWDESNSIVLPKVFSAGAGHVACETLANNLMRTDLYALYCNAMANALNYRPETYCRRHIAANVEKYL